MDMHDLTTVGPALPAPEPELLISTTPTPLLLPTHAMSEEHGESPEDTVSVFEPLRRHWKLFLAVFVVYGLLYLIMFRGILWELPSLLRGDSVINTDELVPFFNVHSQFLDQLTQNFSSLTNGYEFRLRYAILTTWMRYAPILPFAIILGPFLSAYACFVACSLFLRRLLRRELSTALIIHASSLSVLLMNFLLLYSKIIHFYTLIMGWNQCTIAILLLLYGALLARRRVVLSLILASLLAVTNPAIHFVVLYLLVMAVTVMWLLCSAAFTARFRPTLPALTQVSRALIISVLSVLLVIVPYALFIKLFVLRGITDITDTVPVNYALIQSSSVTLLQQLSFDIGSVMDGFLYGRYTLSYARPSKLFYFLLLLLPLIGSVRRMMTDRLTQRSGILLLFVLFISSVWSAMGYPTSDVVPTLHTTLASAMQFLYFRTDAVSHLLINGIGIFINILRFPHRFQFITFTCAVPLIALGWIAICHRMSDRIAQWGWTPSKLTRLSSMLLATALFFVPLFCNWEFRIALFSGDLLGYTHPLDITSLREVKDALQSLPSGRIIVLPSVETGKRIVDGEGIVRKFIDKFYIYFFNQPSYYYGITGDLDNKKQFVDVYQSLIANRHGWLNMLRNLKIRYIVLNKTIGPNPVPGVQEYVKGVEGILTEQLSAMETLLHKRFENGSFIVYEIAQPQSVDAEERRLDLPWNAYACLLEGDLHLTQTRSLVLPSSLHQQMSSALTVTEYPQSVALNDYVSRHPDSFVRPDASSFAFSRDHVPSSFYSAQMFSMFVLSKPGPYNASRANMILHGLYGTLTGSFVSLPRKTVIRFPLGVPADGSYEVFLRGVTTKNLLGLGIDSSSTIPTSEYSDIADVTYADVASLKFDQPMYRSPGSLSRADLEQAVPDKIFPIAQRFSYVDLGQYSFHVSDRWLYVAKDDNNPLIVEGLLFVPRDHLQEAMTHTGDYQFFSPALPLP